MRSVACKKFYQFEKPLVEGIILERRASFVMICSVDGETVRCHCPTMGRIGEFDNIGRPCLLSPAKEPNRATKYTVEAISLNRPGDKSKKWIGINQTRVNRYIEFFLRKNLMSKMIDTTKQKVLREQALEKSRLDFLVGNTYLEVKTPLHFIDLPIPKYVKLKPHAPLTATDRMVKHVTELANSLKTHQRAIELNVFIYDAPEFRIKPEHHSKDFDNVGRAVQFAVNKGLELWQAVLEIDKNGVKLKDYYKFRDNWMDDYIKHN